jgi:hypothetical protein
MARKLKMSTSEFDLTKLCTPSTIYFVLSLIGLILISLNNLNNKNVLCVGNYNCNVGNTTTIFILNAIYILFWTFILDLMCKAGYSSLSWFVLLLPFIIIIVTYISLMKEGFEGFEEGFEEGYEEKREGFEEGYEEKREGFEEGYEEGYE